MGYPSRGKVPRVAVVRKLAVRGTLLTAAIVTGPWALAQGAITPPEAGIDEPGPPRLRTPTLPRKQAPMPSPPLKLPPVRPSPRERGRLASGLKVFVHRFELAGNTIFSDQALKKVTAPFENRVITADELQEVRYRLTLYYVNRGYVNSGAVIPDQKVANGVIRLRIIEGRLSQINITGNKGLRTGYISPRVTAGAKTPLNITKLQENLQLLQQDAMIKRINASLAPGAAPGESALNLSVEEESPYDVGFVVANDRPPSVGGEHAEIYVADRNLTGWGDTLGVQYGRTISGADDIAGFYTRPLNASDTTLSLSASRSDSTVIEEPFNDLDIDSNLTSYEIALTHPLYRTPQQTFTLGLTLNRRHSETFLLGRPFSFSPGVQDGKSTVTALRFSQAWVDRDLNQVIAARSTLSLGVDLFGATVNSGTTPDGRYLAWLGQVQWVRRFDDRGDQFVYRADLQLAKDGLLPLEQFAVGGASTVRGYRENQLVRDNGFVTSAEFRIPLFRLPLPYLSRTEEDGVVQIAPFADFGWADDVDRPTPDPDTISSVGLGLRWDPNQSVHTELYWGYALRDIDNLDHDLQDSGIHFRVEIF